MKMLTLILFIACFTASAKGLAQNISVSLKNAPLEKVFKEIERQSHYRFVYTKEQLAIGFPVTIDIKNSSLESVLFICFKDQPVTYAIENKYILIKNVEKKKLVEALNDIRGKIVNEKGEPVSGLTITIKGTNRTTVSNNDGEFYFKEIDLNAVLVISGAEWEQQEIKVNGQSNIIITAVQKIGTLDETIVMGYGTTTRRNSTGNIAKVSAAEISRQPVSNVLAALEGRVPGLIVTQKNGYAGGGIQVQLRGQNSLLQGSQPFFIIDGVPFATGNDPLNQLSNAASQISPFYTINPADIESIEILKDADATAIYGSRGANGVILITTKKGKAGKTKVDFNTYTGFSKVSRTMDMLTTAQYVQMRKEAYANDGVSIPSSATDLLLWDTTRYTDFKKLFIGGTAHTTDMQLSVSGGSATTQFLIGTGLHRESTVLPTDLADTRASAHVSINHASVDKRFSIALKSIFATLRNNLPTQDMTSLINRPPNLKLYDSLDNLNWQEGGVSFGSLGFAGDYANPLAVFKTSYSGDFQNLSNNLLFSYQLFPGLSIRSNVGYNMVTGNEKRLHPSSSLNPFGNQLPFAYFATQTQKSWIAEPQLEYQKVFPSGKLTMLVGATWQENSTEGISIDASNYSNDLLISTVAAAGTVRTINSYAQYKYTAMFGRINYNLKEKYILNLSARRDGSSRFGPDNRFSNFGAVGMAWIFSNETFIRKNFSFLSFGKLRGSYGITGNDQIGNYKFIDTWNTSSAAYQQIPVILPTGLFNPDLAWESNKKLEFGIDLNFLKDRIQLSFAYFNNKSGNQLVSYGLPIQTGFSSITKNLDAVIINTGVEISLLTQNIKTKNFRWTSGFNVSVTKNKLIAFPGLATSTYANNYVIGQPLSLRKLYTYTGVDPATGLYTFIDVDQSGTYNVRDRTHLKNTEPRYYGGLCNNLSWKEFALDIFFEFRKQAGVNYITNSLRTPGIAFFNQPLIALQRWRKPGDVTDIQKFTASTSSQTYRNANNLLPLSDAGFTDASFVRCKNISLSWNLPAKTLKKTHFDNTRLYVQMQNAFVLTTYKGGDPETQNINVLPSLKVFTAGFQLTF